MMEYDKIPHALLALTMLIASCGNPVHDKDKNEAADSVAAESGLVEGVDAFHKTGERLTMYNKDGRSLYLERDSSGWLNCYSIENGVTKRLRYGKDYFDEGFFELTYHAYDRYLYIVGDTNPNGIGWLCRFYLYRIDLTDFSMKHINTAAAVRFEPKRITVAEPVRQSNPDANCTAEENWMLHDVHLNIRGDKTDEDAEEYDYRGMERRYGELLVNSTGLP